MNIQSITGALGKGALCLFLPGAAGLLSGCQSPPPVREYRVEQRTDCSPCGRACVTSVHATEVQRNISVWPVAERPSARPYLFTPKAGACPLSLNPPIGNAYTTADQNYPDGIRHLAGGPLYYESQNLNWEQAPPFGTW
jgi:hypothetical protein